MICMSIIGNIKKLVIKYLLPLHIRLFLLSHTEAWISDEITVNIVAASCYKANTSSKMKETMLGSNFKNRTTRITTKMRGLNFEV